MSAEGTRIASFDDFIALAVKDGIPHVVDRESQVVQIPTKSGLLEGFLFVRWEKTLPYCQAIHPMIMEVPPERVAAVENALGRINHAVALPGFAYDYDRRFIYFR